MICYFSRDIFPVLRNPALLEDLINLLAEEISNKAKKSGCNIDAVVGLDSRGFLFGPMISTKLGIAFVPIRKKGKLPGKCARITYKLEYGEVRRKIPYIQKLSREIDKCHTKLDEKTVPKITCFETGAVIIESL
jgi:adenine phosphoribosyltransferase